MKKIIKFVIPISVLILVLIPFISFAYTLGEPLVPPCDASVEGQCIWGWNEMLKLVDNVITFILYYMVLPISAIMFAYAGFLMLTSGGSTESRSKAKSIFTSVVMGLVIALGAWLIISTLLGILGYDGAWIGF